MFNQRLAYTNRLQLLIVYVFMCNNLETMTNKHEMSGKGKTVVFPCDIVHGMMGGTQLITVAQILSCRAYFVCSFKLFSYQVPS